MSSSSPGTVATIALCRSVLMLAVVVMSVSVCLSVREHIYKTTRGSVLLWRGVAICYVLPVLKSMTSL